MTAKTVSRQAVRQRSAALGEGAKPDPIKEALNESVADANTEALAAMAAQMRKPAREPMRVEELPPGAVVGRNGEVLMRKRGQMDDIFFIPPELKDPDYDYNWKTELLLNEPQTARQVNYKENGWRPVITQPGSRWAGIYMENDYVGPIRREGQVLMERPMVLTQQAWDDERKAANALMRNTRESLKLAMPQGFTQDHAGVRPNIQQSYERGPAPVRPNKSGLISD